jgi:lysozyme
MKLTTTLVLASLTFTAACSSSAPAPNHECTDATSEELRRCATGTTLKGVDVSVYQGNVSWTKVRRSGRRFAFARVSDGESFHDSKFHANWVGMKRAGLVRGAYQFFRPGQSAHAQAEVFFTALRNAGGLRAGDLPPVLDIEVTDGHSSSVVVSRAKAWLQLVEAHTGVRPIVYTASFMSSVLGSHLSGYRLWVANFGASCPIMPTGWGHWQFFQDSDRGSVPGIAGRVDLDLFNGNLGHLEAATLAKRARLSNEAPAGVLHDAPELPARDLAEPDDAPFLEDDGVEPSESIPQDGSEGQTLGSQAFSDAPAEDAPAAPCP